MYCNRVSNDMLDAPKLRTLWESTVKINNHDITSDQVGMCGVTCTIMNSLCNFQWILRCIKEIIWLLVQPTNLEAPGRVTVDKCTSICITFDSSTACFNWSCLDMFVYIRNVAIIFMFKQGLCFRGTISN